VFSPGLREQEGTKQNIDMTDNAIIRTQNNDKKLAFLKAKTLQEDNRIVKKT